MTASSLEPVIRRLNRFHLGGEWAAPRGDGRIDVVSPSTEEVVAQVPAPTTADIDAAVAAARRAFEGPRRSTTRRARSTPAIPGWPSAWSGRSGRVRSS
ncbi:aldehyde dehydrogenase family protein [Actinomadura rugatobispora]|uniref:Aldehyde dehydrogenase family protein n=1 Tax=Actinomadura rugatobispora TaxID=1994 RepID=A0ABW1A008_9ACTN